MVIKFVYRIRFLEEASFQTCPKFLVYQMLWHHIKKMTCLWTKRLCQECSLQSQCIYYKISGERFEFYPAIFVRRDLYEKMHYLPNETMDIELFLLGNTYIKQYIHGFFEQLTQIHRVNVYLKEVKTSTHKEVMKQNIHIRLLTPTDWTCLDEQIQYYQEQYHAQISKIQFEDITQRRLIRDRRSYRIDSKRFFYQGEIAEMNCKEISSIWFELGIGKWNFLGGGAINAD